MPILLPPSAVLCLPLFLLIVHPLHYLLCAFIILFYIRSFRYKPSQLVRIFVAPSFKHVIRVCTIYLLPRPVWGEPAGVERIVQHADISTYSPRTGRTLGLLCQPLFFRNFNSLAPREANLRPAKQEIINMIISTHSPRARRTLSTLNSISMPM